MATYNLLVKLLDGKTLTVKLPSSTINGELLERYVHSATRIPTCQQLLLADGHRVSSDTVLSAAGRLFPTVHLLLRLRGGKGGFGSLLRGAATKAGQKKTNNFDACRDMSGRRLRHVNAERRLEEWRAEAEERRLEKIAEEFIKKKAKAGKRGAGDGVAEKYVEKYREESAKCVEAMEASVRETIQIYKNSKRKVSAAPQSEAKRLKIWTGKKKLDGSDSDDEGTDDDNGNDKDEENEKSVILDGGNSSDSNKEAEGSSGSVSCGKVEVGECSGGGLCESGSEEEKEIVVQVNSVSSGSPGELGVQGEAGCVVELKSFEEHVIPSTSCSETAMALGTEAAEAEKFLSNENESGVMEVGVGQPRSNACKFEIRVNNAGTNGFSESKSVVDEGIMVSCNENLDVEKSLNLDDFSSATEMEALGMETLKSELQAQGLKCGGTLQERAARLFLLKFTPLEKLPKKLLAKK